MKKIRDYVLSKNEAKYIESLALQLISEHKNNLKWLMSNAKLISDEFPLAVREFIYEFKMREESLGICIKGNIVNDSEIGHTPSRYFHPKEKEVCSKEEVMFILYAEVLGNVFGWNSVQNGNIISEIIPIKENYAVASSSGAKNDFGLHTEDAFHPYRGDYLTLFGMRAPEDVNTTLSFISPNQLSDEAIEALSKSEFVIGTNVGHNMDTVTECSSVLYGGKESQYFTINMNNTFPTTQRAEDSLHELYLQLKKNEFGYAVKQGDFFVIDNFRCIHGREKYQPRYDGSDRWLKRILVANDLRKSRNIRITPSSRILNANPNLSAEATFIKH